MTFDPTNTAYNDVVDGVQPHSGATVAAGKKYITTDALYPDGSGGHLASGSWAMCTSASPEAWVALSTPPGTTLVDSSSGAIYRFDTAFTPLRVSLRVTGNLNTAVGSANSLNVPLMVDNQATVTVPATATTLTAPLVWDGGVIADGGHAWSITGPVSCPEGAQMFSVTGSHIALNGNNRSDVSACWFGAKGDSGTTDNTTAINAALSALGPSLAAVYAGGVVRVPAASGYYKITTPLNILYSGTTLCGDGEGTVIAQASGQNGIVNGAAGTIYDVRIENMTLVSAGGAAIGIYGKGFTKAIISNIGSSHDIAAYSACFRICVQLETVSLTSYWVYDTIVQDCLLTYQDHAAAIGINLVQGSINDGITTCSIRRNWIQNNLPNTNGIGIQISGESHIVRENVMEFADTHIKFVASLGQTRSNHVYDNYLEGAGTAEFAFEDDANVYANTVGPNTQTTGNITDPFTGTYARNFVKNNIVSSQATPFFFLATNSATPTVVGVTELVTSSTVATSITNFLKGYRGQIITLLANDNNTTIVNNASIMRLKGAANFAMLSGDTLTLMLSPSAIWFEVARSVNH